MGQAEKETVRRTSEGVSREFKTLIDAEDLDSLRQLKHLMSMKSRILATYPDAFPDGSTEVLDRRPDLEMPQQP